MCASVHFCTDGLRSKIEEKKCQMLGTEEDDLQSKIWYCTEQELLVRLTKLIREIWCVTLQWLRRNCGRGRGDSPRRRAEEAPLFLELPVAHCTVHAAIQSLGRPLLPCATKTVPVFIPHPIINTKISPPRGIPLVTLLRKATQKAHQKQTNEKSYLLFPQNCSLSFISHKMAPAAVRG
jgi:hypothetical protein